MCPTSKHASVVEPQVEVGVFTQHGTLKNTDKSSFEGSTFEGKSERASQDDALIQNKKIKLFNNGTGAPNFAKSSKNLVPKKKPTYDRMTTF